MKRALCCIGVSLTAPCNVYFIVMKCLIPSTLTKIMFCTLGQK